MPRRTVVQVLTKGCRRITSGTIDVPDGMARTDFAEIEGAFREFLWPKLHAGFVRFARSFKWLNNRTLSYYIIDLRKSPLKELAKAQS